MQKLEEFIPVPQVANQTSPQKQVGAIIHDGHAMIQMSGFPSVVSGIIDFKKMTENFLTLVLKISRYAKAIYVLTELHQVPN